MKISRLRVILLIVAPLLSLAGILVFLGAVLVEFFSSRVEISGSLTPSVQIALGGLCLTATTFFLWLTLVGFILARQSRQQGSGYADAYRLIESFRFGEAIPLLERSVREGKETAEVLMLLTSAYAYAGQLGKAQATADRAVRLFPDDPGSYITLANGYRIQAAYDEAARALTKAAELQPDQPIIWAELGFAQRFAGDFRAATESFERATHHAMPAMYGVRVYFHLAQSEAAEGKARQAMAATARMMSARHGLDTWESGLSALGGTTYGQALAQEITAIRQALKEVDSALT